MHAEELTADEANATPEEIPALDILLRQLAFGCACVIVALCAALFLHQLVGRLGTLAERTPGSALHQASDRLPTLLPQHRHAADRRQAETDADGMNRAAGKSA